MLLTIENSGPLPRLGQLDLQNNKNYISQKTPSCNTKNSWKALDTSKYFGWYVSKSC
jgi:hypothetical protein